VAEPQSDEAGIWHGGVLPGEQQSRLVALLGTHLPVLTWKGTPAHRHDSIASRVETKVSAADC
jgi:hypothetical protein